MNINFRIYFRALEPDDYKKTHEWRKDILYRQNTMSLTRYVSSDTEKRWLEKAIKDHEVGNTFRFCMILKERNEMIGLFYIHSIDMRNRTAGHGVWIGDKNYRGKGYATEARHLALRYAFEELGLKRVEGKCLGSSLESISHIESFGYTKEGVKRSAVFKNGKFNDVYIYSMLKDEYYKIYGESI